MPRGGERGPQYGGGDGAEVFSCAEAQAFSASSPRFSPHRVVASSSIGLDKLNFITVGVEG